LGSIETSRKGLVEANRYLESQGKKRMFDVQLAGYAPQISLEGGIYSVRPEIVLSRLKTTDLVLIPAFQDDIAEGLEKNRAAIPWLVRQYQSGAELASLCTGAFVLAATGLLRDKNCSTHWRAA